MLSFLRRLTHSKVGVIVTLAVLVVIALAFAAGDITNFGAGSSGTPTGTTVATVGKTRISADSLKTQTQNEMNSYRQQNPQLTMAEYVQGGGFDATISRMISSLALAQFGRAQGMVVSKKSVDGQIASIPSLQGLNGKFDPALYQQLLQQQRLTDAGVRAEIAQDAVQRLLRIGVEAQHQHRRGVGRAHQAPAVVPVHAQAIDRRQARTLELRLLLEALDEAVRVAVGHLDLDLGRGHAAGQRGQRLAGFARIQRQDLEQMIHVVVPGTEPGVERSGRHQAHQTVALTAGNEDRGRGRQRVFERILGVHRGAQVDDDRGSAPPG